MNILAILKAVLSLADWLAKIAHDKQLLDAGEAKAISKASQEALNNVKAAQEARANLKHDDTSIMLDRDNRDNR